MKKVLALFGLLFAVGVAHAGTPQETYFQGQAPLSGNTILVSSAATGSNQNITLTVSTPTAINSGGASYTGRNCFTRLIIQVSTAAVVTMKDNNTTVWTLYGAGLGTTGTNTISLPEDHLGPLCTASGDQTSFVITNTGGASVNPEAINVEGYTTYGGTLNAGPML